MLSIKAIKAGGEDYYLDLAAEDYYFNGGEPPGKWMGAGSRLLGLGTEKRVEREHLKRLFRGYHPTVGNDDPKDPAGGLLPLVQNAGKKNRTAGLDLTFSMPKSVSVIWSQGETQLYDDIRSLGEAALEETLLLAEEKLGFARTGKRGEGVPVSAKLTFATFEHGTSRACEPQLHWHALLTNVAYCSDGQYRAVDLRPFFRNKMLLGAIFRSKVAAKLRSELGLKAYRRGNCFDVVGVPQEVIDAHSTRAKEIRRALKEKGLIGAKAAAVAAVATREEKKHTARRELLEEWKETNQAHGFDDADLNKLIKRSANKKVSTKNISQILKEALKAVEKRYNHFTELDFLKEALYVAPEYGVPFEDLVHPVSDFLHDSGEIVPIPVIAGQTRYAARSVLELETTLLKQLGKLHRRKGLRVKKKLLERVLEGEDYARLNAKQKTAIRHVTRDTHAIRVVQGYAGTGKTTMLKAAVEAWTEAGFNVVGACFTGKAARVLQEEIKVPCGTINMTLADFEQDLFTSLKRRLKHHVRQFVREAKGQKTFAWKSPQPKDINKRTIVLVDEAGMVGTRHMSMLMKWANDNNATLVLTGDEAQLPSVEGGSPLMSISNRVGCARMTDIVRQNAYWSRNAAYYLARGEVGKAVELYDQRGLLKVDDDTESAIKRVLSDWEIKSFDRLASTRIIATTNALVEEINEAAQERLIARGVLDPDHSLKVTDVGNKTGPVYESRVHVGDQVLFTKNNKDYDVSNGEAGEVIAFGYASGEAHQETLVVKIHQERGERIVTVPISFEHIRLGYASTVEKTQGETLEEAYVLLAGGYQNLPRSYVQGTRARSATHLYTTRDLYDQMQELEDSLLISQMQQKVDLSLAVDLFVPPTAAAKDLDSLRDKVLHDWKAQSDKSGCLIVTRNEEQADEFNERCSQLQYAMAQTDWEKRARRSAPTTRQAKLPIFEQDGNSFTVGSRVRICERGTIAQANHQHKLGTIESIDPERETVEVRMDLSGLVPFTMDSIPKLDHGYAVSFEQANTGGYRMKRGLFVDAFGQSYSDPWDVSGSTSQSGMQRTVFDNNAFTQTTSENRFRFETADTYLKQDDYNRMAAAHQRRVHDFQRQQMQQMEQSFTQTTIERRMDRGW